MIDVALVAIERALAAVARMPFLEIAMALNGAAGWVRAMRLRRHCA